MGKPQQMLEARYKLFLNLDAVSLQNSKDTVKFLRAVVGGP
jgi:hypothetical protein